MQDVHLVPHWNFMKFPSNNLDGQVWSESAMGYVGGLCSPWCHQESDVPCER